MEFKMNINLKTNEMTISIRYEDKLEVITTYFIGDILFILRWFEF